MQPRSSPRPPLQRPHATASSLSATPRPPIPCSATLLSAYAAPPRHLPDPTESPRQAPFRPRHPSAPSPCRAAPTRKPHGARQPDGAPRSPCVTEQPPLRRDRRPRCGGSRRCCGPAPPARPAAARVNGGAGGTWQPRGTVRPGGARCRRGTPEVSVAERVRRLRALPGSAGGETGVARPLRCSAPGSCPRAPRRAGRGWVGGSRPPCQSGGERGGRREEKANQTLLWWSYFAVTHLADKLLRRWGRTAVWEDGTDARPADLSSRWWISADRYPAGEGCGAESLPACRPPRGGRAARRSAEGSAEQREQCVRRGGHRGRCQRCGKRDGSPGGAPGGAGRRDARPRGLPWPRCRAVSCPGRAVVQALAPWAKKQTCHNSSLLIGLRFMAFSCVLLSWDPV